MSAPEDLGMRSARRSGVTLHMDRATRALNAAAHDMALTHLRLCRAQGGARTAARPSRGPAVGASATNGTRPDLHVLGQENSVAGNAAAVVQAGGTAARPNGAAAASRAQGTTVRPGTAMGFMASSKTASRMTPGGGGLKLVMVPTPLGVAGAGAKWDAHTATDTPESLTRGVAVPAPVLAPAPRTGAGGGVAAAGTSAAKPGGSPPGGGGAAPSRDAARAFPRDRMQAGRGTGLDVGRLVAQWTDPVAPAGGSASPAPRSSPVGQTSMAPARRTSAGPERVGADKPDAGGGAPPYATQPRPNAAGLPERDGRGDGGSAPGGNPTEGDVYLDGALMGRWLARSLAAEAARPASGSAAFDPRRNVFPTGAMIGG